MQKTSQQLILWQIALASPLYKVFDYLPGEHESIVMRPGMRVSVPFGRRKAIGFFCGVVHSTAIPTDKLKAVESVLDDEPVLIPKILKLCAWASEYYHYPLGEVLSNALPKRLRAGKSLSIKMPAQSFTATTSLPLTLNSHQQQALDAVLAVHHFAVFLLAGVTGSGKTEVYLQTISAVLAQGKNALVLVPEIGLTPQTVMRFAQRFTQDIAVLHSGLTDAERMRMWYKAYKNQARIIIGTRSAIFAPLSNIGIIIVDEEHDTSFKSQSGLRYSARDVAVMRAQLENCPVILGSATPSSESFYNAVRARYQLLHLPERAGESQMPRVTTINLRDKKLISGLSAETLDAMKQQLAAKKQVLLFLNRRGYAPLMLCHHCGYVVTCSRCDAKLTLHYDPARLICHHCDKAIKPIRICTQCHQTELVTLGQGTEQLEMALAELFPDCRVLRIDRDTTNSRNRLAEKIEQINNGEADILIGTQMLAKGHHFSNLGLSVILDIDHGFFSVDFRAIERTAQLVVQVAGRAGRETELGQVIIQTHHPEHPYLQTLLQRGYFTFMHELLKERKLAELPPFVYQAVVRAEAGQRNKPVDFLGQVRSMIDEVGIKKFGPMPAMMEKKAGRFRHYLLLQSPARGKLQACLKKLVDRIVALPTVRSVRWSVDVDPSDVV